MRFILWLCSLKKRILFLDFKWKSVVKISKGMLSFLAIPSILLRRPSRTSISIVRKETGDKMLDKNDRVGEKF